MTDLVAWARGLTPVGTTVVIAVEGRSGAGKTTSARVLAAELGAPLIRMDDLYPGWDGLRAGSDALGKWVLRPLAEGRRARWRRWDWAAGRYAGTHEVPAGRHLVVEGVGAGAAPLRPYLSGLIWVEAPEPLRRRRAMARDGGTYAPHWERWARQEDEYYGSDHVRDHADLVIEHTEDGT
ncbi:nucleoside/nucleotide kinase family protein [Actinoplanes sp. RD1]|uniref:dephospho-CoA kinase n=1 Tax=Actinoplanes sp. RD1 TaxID=3064538 RepID=UPI00274061AE|nr:dephospho-CoA kinase [Actinoplanes sp. RD1]